MALIKRKTRKKLTKQLNKIVKRHGAEMALALVTGILSNLAAKADGKRVSTRKVVVVAPERRPRVRG
jgi:hypothetical protein